MGRPLSTPAQRWGFFAVISLGLLMIGHRLMFLVGLAIFGLASLAVAFTPSA